MLQVWNPLLNICSVSQLTQTDEKFTAQSVELQIPDPTVPKESDLPHSPLALFPSPQKRLMLVAEWLPCHKHLFSFKASFWFPIEHAVQVGQPCSSNLIDSEWISGSSMGSWTEQDPKDKIPWLTQKPPCCP